MQSLGSYSCECDEGKLMPCSFNWFQSGLVSVLAMSVSVIYSFKSVSHQYRMVLIPGY